MTGHDLRLVPLAAVGWVMTWCLVEGVLRGWKVLLVGVGWVLVAAIWRKPVVVATSLLAVTVLVTGWMRTERLAQGQLAGYATDRALIDAEGYLQSEPLVLPRKQGRDGLAIARLELVSISARGTTGRTRLPVKLVATGPGIAELQGVAPGSLIRVSSRVVPAEQGEPVAAVLRMVGSPAILDGPGPLDGAVNRVRSGLRAAMVASPAPQAALLPSLVVGDTSAIPPQMSDQFKATALTHLLAVSGANLTLLLAFLLVVVKRLGVRGWPVRAISALGVAVFVLICRAEPSVIRAAAMGTVALAALGAGRDREKGIRHLCVAVVVLLLFEPWLSNTWGFALSVAASGGILLWGASWQEMMRSWAPGWLAEAICIPLAAQLATQPLITALSGQVSVIGLAANAAVGAFVGPATILGMLAAIFSAFWIPLGVPFGWLAGWLVQPIIWGAQLGAGLPAPVITLGPSAAAVIFTCFSVVVLAVILGRQLHRPRTFLILIATLLIMSVWRPGPPGWPGDWDVVFCDVGQGDATVIRVGPEQAVLVDTGPDNGAAARCLRELGIGQVPLLVLTHYHSDHIGGLESVLDEVQVDLVLVSQTSSPQKTAERTRKTLEDAGARVESARVGETIQVGPLTWSTIAAGQDSSSCAEPGSNAEPGDNGGESAMENDSSVIGVINRAGLKVMLAGDAEPGGQSLALRMKNLNGLDLSADVLKLPHHGSSKQDLEFIKAVGADIALVSAGENNEYGHPASKTLRLVQSLGMSIWRTDTQGSIALALRPSGMSVRQRGR